jgi:RHS repeat-associated protein
MTDATKAATWTPWGEPQSLTGSAINNLRFPGQYFLIETGHAYNWHRSYDPVSGRYTQPDPLRFIDGPSIYAYAGNSPLIKTDRSGLFTIGKLGGGELPHSTPPRGGAGNGAQSCQAMDCDDAYVKCLQIRGMIKGGKLCGKARDNCKAGLPTISAPGTWGKL